MSRAWALAILSLFAVACGGEDGDGGYACEDAYRELITRVEADWDDPHVCTADTECVIETGRLGAFDGCDGVSFSLCGWVVHTDSAAQLREHVREVAAPICADTEPSSCGATCPEIDPACVDGRCVDAAARDR